MTAYMLGGACGLVLGLVAPYLWRFVRAKLEQLGD